MELNKKYNPEFSAKIFELNRANNFEEINDINVIIQISNISTTYPINFTYEYINR